MYSYEDRIKAVELYIKYDLSAADTIRELGYPKRNMLVRWYRKYQEKGDLHKKYIKHPKYTSEQIQVAVNYYLEHGRSIARTIKAVGYPTKETLKGWVDELAPGKRKVRIKRSPIVQFSKGQKREAVVELCSREESAAAVADWCRNIITRPSNIPGEIANLNKLLTMLKDEPYSHFTLEQFTRLGSPEDQVVLSTRHGAKGLEFDIVIMLGMEEGSFPRYGSLEREK